MRVSKLSARVWGLSVRVWEVNVLLCLINIVFYVNLDLNIWVWDLGSSGKWQGVKPFEDVSKWGAWTMAMLCNGAQRVNE